MEFDSRERNKMQQNSQSAGYSQGPQHSAPKRRGGVLGKFLRLELFTVIVGSALLLAAVALYLGFSDKTAGSETKQINSKQYQALFLSNGQVYFGKINSINDKFVVVKNIFYIEGGQTAQQSQPNNSYTLRKLGTNELHAPEDKMVINKEQITFWENLKDSSQVVTKINEYYKNPDAANSQPTTNTPATPQNTSNPATR